MQTESAAALVKCRVASLQPFNHDITRVMLQPLDPAVLEFRAGQYIHLVLDDGSRRPFSLAGAPREDHRLELHIRDLGSGELSRWLAHNLEEHADILIQGPLGDFHLHDSGRPLIMVAGGTGFAPVKGLVEESLRRDTARPLYLYWGAKNREDLYLESLPRQWASEYEHIRFIPVLSGAAAAGYRSGLVHEAVLEDFPELEGFEVYVCGPKPMIQALQPLFTRHGLPREQLFSDMFAFMDG